VSVTVSYKTMSLVALPGLLPSSLTITRSVEMPVRG